MHGVSSELELAIVDEVNLVRARPREYAGYVHAMAARGGEHFEELFNVLRVRNPVHGLKVAKGLSLAAMRRAEAVAAGAPTGESAHALTQRVSKYARVDEPASLKEVVWLGRHIHDVRKTVLSLLCDDGNPTRSRRSALLSSTSTTCGIACSGNVLIMILAKSALDSTSSTITSNSIHSQVFASHHTTATPATTGDSDTKPLRQYARLVSDRQTPASPVHERVRDYSDIRKMLDGHHKAETPKPQQVQVRREQRERPQQRVVQVPLRADPSPVVVHREQQPQQQQREQREREQQRESREQREREQMLLQASQTKGHIIGLQNIKTTLAQDNGESNYVGYTDKLKHRIHDWLDGVNSAKTAAAAY